MVLLQNPNNGYTKASKSSLTGPLGNGDGIDLDVHRCNEVLDSACSTPFVSAPSSPGRGSANVSDGYFFSAPASPMHFVLASSMYQSSYSSVSTQSDMSSTEFEFSSRFAAGNGLESVGSMTSADELFLNGRIRPMKLSSYLQSPQIFAPHLDPDVEVDCAENKDDNEFASVSRGRDLKNRSRSLRRKARSLSPLRNADFQWEEEDCCRENEEINENDEHILELQEFVECKESESVSTETTPSCSGSSSRSSSSGRNSKKWIFLKDLLHRSKSEGRGNGKEKLWSSLSFSPSKEKKLKSPSLTIGREEKPPPMSSTEKQKRNAQVSGKKTGNGKPSNGVGKRRTSLSAHELHYTTNRAQAEEMKKRTFLPYRQGLLGCLGFNSKGYGALNGLTRTLNPVSSR